MTEGIRSDRYGIRAYVKVGGIQREKRFRRDADPDTIQQWRLDTGRALRLKRTHATPDDPGTLAADVTRYLKLVRAMPTYEQRADHLDLWIDALDGCAFRHSITPDRIREVLQRWHRSGLSAATCNKRRTALMHLFSTLDGKDARNPVRAVPKFRAADPLPRGRDFALLRHRLEQMPRSDTRTRLLVMLWTGMRPVEVMRAKATDVDWKARYIVVRTAKGGRTRTVPLTAAAVAVLREFDRRDLWEQTFTLAPMNRMIKAACKIPDITVYDLRHSYGTTLAKKRIRLDVIGALMGHSSLELTKRYTLAAVTPEAAEATKRLATASRTASR